MEAYGHNVELRLPPMAQAAVRSLDAALHAADRGIGVGTGGAEDGGGRYDCPCCDRPTLAEPPPGTYEICDVCGWEDDSVQFGDPDYEGGANRESLRQARAAFRAS